MSKKKFNSTGIEVNFLYYRELGDEWTVPPDVLNAVEEFTCSLYGYPRETSVNSVRVQMLNKMVGEDDNLSRKSKVDLSKIPPCQDSLVPYSRE